MNPIGSVSAVFSNYFNFSEWSPRSEFWWFLLLISVVFVAIVSAWGFLVAQEFDQYSITNYLLTGFLYFFILALLVPLLSVSTRRLHDTN